MVSISITLIVNPGINCVRTIFILFIILCTTPTSFLGMTVALLRGSTRFPIALSLLPSYLKERGSAFMLIRPEFAVLITKSSKFPKLTRLSSTNMLRASLLFLRITLSSCREKIKERDSAEVIFFATSRSTSVCLLFPTRTWYFTLGANTSSVRVSIIEVILPFSPGSSQAALRLSSNRTVL